LHLLSQPAGKGVFEFNLSAATVEVADRLPDIIEWDEPARCTLVSKPRRHKLDQGTVAARMRTCGLIEVNASWGVFEHIRSPPPRP
jgi:hypothetical protein